MYLNRAVRVKTHRKTTAQKLAEKLGKKNKKSLKRLVTAKATTEDVRKAALEEARRRVAKNPKSDAQEVLDAYDKKLKMQDVAESKRLEKESNINYAKQAVKKPEKVLGKNVKGNFVEKNPYFNVKKDGTIIGVQNPDTLQWSGIEPASKRGRKTPAGKVDITEAIEQVVPAVKDKKKPQDQMELELGARNSAQEEILKEGRNAKLVKAAKEGLPQKDRKA